MHYNHLFRSNIQTNRLSRLAPEFNIWTDVGPTNDWLLENSHKISILGDDEKYRYYLLVSECIKNKT